jgi:hypothetical protein
MRPKKYRSPERPRGLYAAYLDELIERNRRKRDPATDIADESYWHQRRKDEALKDLPFSKSA